MAPVAAYPVRPDGRWSGRVTSRPLPLDDHAVDALGADDRRTLAGIWLSQAATERRVAYSFEVVAKALEALDADAGLVAVARRAVDDEFRHAELCRTLASRYAGRALDAPEELPFAHPTHPAARSEPLRQALYVVGQCCFNETFASAYLEHTLETAQTPLARAALRELLSDEVDHARLGWAFAATLPAPLRADLEDWAHPLAVCNLREWRALSLPTARRDVLGPHGVPSREGVERALREALDDMIIPGFERFGFAVPALRAWSAAGAPT